MRSSRGPRCQSLIADLDPTAPDLEGYLFPETYTVSRTTSAQELVAAMVSRFRDNFPEASRQRAEAEGFSVRAGR